MINREPVNCRLLQTVGQDDPVALQQTIDGMNCLPGVEDGIFILLIGTVITSIVGYGAAITADTVGMAVIFTTLAALVGFGGPYLVDTSQCRAYRTALRDRLYQATVSRVPDGYLQAKRLSEVDLAIIHQLAK